MSETNYHSLPQPEEIPTREKEDAMGAYLMMFAALGAGLPLPIINLIAAVIYYFVNKSNSRFVTFHSYQAMISQFPTSIMNAVMVFWGLRIAFTDSWALNEYYIGFVITTIVANLVYIIFSIIGAVKARKGKMYYFMFFGQLAYHKAFAVRESDIKQPSVNLPPRF